MRNYLKTLTGQSLVFGLGNLLPRIVGFLLIPVYTQYLSRADYGIINFIASVESILLSISALGIDAAYMRYYFDHSEDLRSLRNFYGSAWIGLTGFALILTLSIDRFGIKLFESLFSQTPYEPYGKLGIWLAFFTTASLLPSALLRARQQAWRYIAFSTSRFILTTCLIIYFVVGRKDGAIGSLKAQVISAGVFFLVFTVFSFFNMRLNIRWQNLRSLLRFGLPLVPHQISGWALNVSDRIILERMVSLDQLGLYSLGYRMAMFLDLILNSVNMAWSPFFYKLASSDQRAPSVIARLTTLYASMVTFLAVGMALVVRSLYIIIANPRYHSAYQITMVVILAYIFHAAYFMLVNQLFYAKQTRNLPVYTMVSAGINIMLNILLVPHYGILAAAWNTVIGYAILAILVFRESSKVFPIPYQFQHLLKIGLAGGATFLIGNALQFDSAWLEIFLRITSLISYPLLLLFTGVVSMSEVKTLWKAISTKLSRIVSRNGRNNDGA